MAKSFSHRHSVSAAMRVLLALLSLVALAHGENGMSRVRREDNRVPTGEAGAWDFAASMAVADADDAKSLNAAKDWAGAFLRSRPWKR